MLLGCSLCPSPPLQLHLKFCYEALLLHAEQVLHRHGVGVPAAPKAANSASSKVGAGFGSAGSGSFLLHRADEAFLL